VHDRIVLESIPSNGEFLYRFIDAMKRSGRIKVTYRKYGKDTTTDMTIDPYFVKLIKKRWYGIVKFPEEDSYFFIIAFDRIVDLTLTSEKFTYRKDFDPQGYFKDSYGIVCSKDVPVQRVVIRAFGDQMYYYRDLPLHHSQKELQSTDEYTDFEVTLRPTEDFYSPLLSRGPYIKVLEPKWLADEIKNMLSSAAKLYDE
jgi:predicted DNA-binding transcriptional regulator YafY